MTVVVVYDMTDVLTPKLERFYTVSGDYSQSRREGNYLYVLSQNWMNINIWGNAGVYTQGEIETYMDTKFDIKKTLPKTVDIHPSSDVSRQLTLKGKKVPFALEKGVVGCGEIEYILPKKPQG
jgi:hypothetical protein